MSRVGNRVTIIPKGVEIKIDGLKVEVTGKLGTLTKEFSPLIAIEKKEQQIFVTRANDEKHTKQLHGTTTALIQNMVLGVSKGFKKELLIKGVGYRMALKAGKIVINAGYSHPVELDIISGIEIKIPKPTEITVSGISKQKVGQMSALIRDIRRPNPYSGKGIMYKGEKIIRKEGKAAGK